MCECGVHDSLAEDKSNVATFEDWVCPFCKGIAMQARIQADKDGKAVSDKAKPADPRPQDGRHTRLRMMSPQEADSIRKNARQVAARNTNNMTGKG